MIDSCKKEGCLTRGTLLDEYLSKLPDGSGAIPELAEADREWACRTMRKLRQTKIDIGSTTMGKTDGVWCYIGAGLSPK